MAPMTTPICLAALLSTSLAAVLPRATSPFPISDGFPNPSAAQLQAIERGAHGTLPNSPIPKFSADTIKSLQLIATNEMYEVALYETCLQKLKAGGPGFGPENFVNPEHQAFVIQTFDAFYHQEEIHAFIGQGGLQANGQPTIKPSQYQFNAETYQDCLDSANFIGDNVLGTSQGVIDQAIAVGDGGLAAQLDSLIAQEGQQSGFLRSEMVSSGKHNRLPGAMPAYTASTRDWLFSVLEQYLIKPGTDTNNIPLPVKLPMAVTNTGIQPVDQVLSFTVNLDPKTGNNYSYSHVHWEPSNLYVTYVTGQNEPFSVPLQDVSVNRGQLTFRASFPAYTKIIDGFAIAALTTANNFTTFQQASDNSIAGPATIELTCHACVKFFSWYVCLEDDVAAVQAAARELQTAGRSIIAHSFGGVVATEALTEELYAAQPMNSGTPGVIRLIYLCAYIPLSGQSLADIFAKHGFLCDVKLQINDNGTAIPSNAEEAFYNDIPEAQRAAYAEANVTHNFGLVGQAKVSHVPWKEVPSIYIYYEQDRAVHKELQENMVQDSRSNGGVWETVTLDAGHCPFISISDELVTTIKSVRTGVE